MRESISGDRSASDGGSAAAAARLGPEGATTGVSRRRVALWRLSGGRRRGSSASRRRAGREKRSKFLQGRCYGDTWPIARDCGVRRGVRDVLRRRSGLPRDARDAAPAWVKRGGPALGSNGIRSCCHGIGA
eukprot:3389592-Prymnesium_polylepis.1